MSGPGIPSHEMTPSFFAVSGRKIHVLKSLLQVMWARWQEAAVLLFHRGLGTQGEMDDAALEDAGFREWVANREKAAADEPGVGVAHGLISIPEDSDSPGGGIRGEGPGQGADIGGIPEHEFDEAMRIALGVFQ